MNMHANVTNIVGRKLKRTNRNIVITYQDVTSSRANSTPPTGALKAAATPAAHPHVTF